MNLFFHDLDRDGHRSLHGLSVRDLDILLARLTPLDLRKVRTCLVCADLEIRTALGRKRHPRRDELSVDLQLQLRGLPDLDARRIIRRQLDLAIARIVTCTRSPPLATLLVGGPVIVLVADLCLLVLVRPAGSRRVVG